MSGVNDIRSSFLDFFAREGHEIVPSSRSRRAVSISVLESMSNTGLVSG